MPTGLANRRPIWQERLSRSRCVGYQQLISRKGLLALPAFRINSKIFDKLDAAVSRGCAVVLSEGGGQTCTRESYGWREKNGGEFALPAGRFNFKFQNVNFTPNSAWRGTAYQFTPEEEPGVIKFIRPVHLVGSAGHPDWSCLVVPFAEPTPPLKTPLSSLPNGSKFW